MRTLPRIGPVEPPSAELNTAQGFELLDKIKLFGNPLMVFTGGDPLKRPDLYEMIRHSSRLGCAPTSRHATPLLTEKAIDRSRRAAFRAWRSAWTGRAQSHDDFRGIPGTFDRAMMALDHPKKIGLETQYQTTVTRRNLARLAEMARLAKEVRTRMWSLFFLIVTGRALENDDLQAAEVREGFRVHVRSLEDRSLRREDHRGHALPALRGAAHEGGAPSAENENARGMWRTAGVSDGKGFVFVSHQGEIYPSGFLPVSGGNVLRDSLRDVYRNSPLFRSLRDTGRREGKCGICEYQKICGGSRSRAYASTGNYLAEDPNCIYQPHLADAIAG